MTTLKTPTSLETTQARADRPRAATLGLDSLSKDLARMRADTPITKHGRDALTLVRDDTMDLVLIALSVGGTLAEHHAPGAISVLVLDGRIAFSANGQRLEAGAHDLLTLEAGVPHAVEALEPSAILVTIAAPTKTARA